MTSARAVQPLNADGCTDVTFSGMVIAVSFVQFSNALEPMLVMLVPIVNSSRAVPLKNSVGMLVTPSPRVTFFKPEQPLNIPLTRVQLTVASVKAEQPLNGVVPTEITLEGITILVKPEFWKALFPIEVVVAGIVKDDNFVQPLNVRAFMLVYFPVPVIDANSLQP